jgi:LacI family transcriptional regulator
MPAKSSAAKVNLGDVAALAGVSPPTVSKVVNGRDDVADATRARVQDALAKLGYESPAQRRSKSAGPELVDLVFHGLDSSYSLQVMAGIVECAAEEGVEIVLSGLKPAKFHSVDHELWAQRLAKAGRKGLIFVTSVVTANQLESFRRRNIPVVVIDPLSPPGSGYVSIGATNWAGGKAATDHLIDLGHRKIAFLGGPETVECSVARLHGYLAALRANNLPQNPHYVLPGRFNRESGVTGARQLFALDDPPTAIFAANDVIALGALDEARRQGIRVPEQLSLVGFDGTDLTEQSVPRLTSVAQPLQEMGWAALRTVLRLAKGETLESNHVELSTKLVVRDSTAPIGA